MKSAKVVVGTGFGDEGKGHLVDYFASEFGKDCTVVRFNGGAQAGHTVVSPDGKRHIFHHFSSGTLTGAKTYLSKFFVVNPILFRKEFDTLQKLGISPITYADQCCLVTTPYDMIINQILETNRGYKRYGSCGLGFNETVERSMFPEFRIDIKMLFNTSLLLDILKEIVTCYLPKRLQKLGIVDIPKFFMDVLMSPTMVENYFDDIRFFTYNIGRVDEVLLMAEDNVIFEGAQGLLLDQDHLYFPHVTRSKTGISNVLELIKDTDIDFLDIIYITRPYATRHGAGPFPHEINKLPRVSIVDKTNIDHEFQGSLRYGLLDLDTLYTSIIADTCKIDSVPYSINLAINCMDQMDERIDFINGALQSKNKEQFINQITNKIPINDLYIGNGETRNDIEYRSKPLRS